jgi:asparagine synthase (glutamine-hydrolysing)
MVHALAHRGPDGLNVTTIEPGNVVFGHARLAIIDLSASGVQPMSLANLWITFNGEIYNHRELRRELERDGTRFRSTSDTEVLLAGYARWGTEVLDRVDGIFAFALWDDRRRELLLVRDHLGVKPLYYARLSDGGVAFASEPKALLDVVPSRTPDADSIRDVLSYGYIPGTRSAFKGISKLAPGHSLTWTENDTKVREYWSVVNHAARPARTTNVVESCRDLIDAASSSQLESDVPVGVLVSGGIDSSAVASSAVRAHPSLDAFVLGYPGNAADERPFAKLLAERVGLRLHDTELQPDIAEALLARCIAAHDEPLADSSSIPTFALFEFVHARSFKVVLAGDGGDELFAGYRRYEMLLREEGHSQSAWPLKVFGARSVHGAARILAHPVYYQRPAWMSYYERIRIFGPDEQTRLLMRDWTVRDASALTWPFEKYWRSDLDTVKAAQVFDIQTYLPEDILAKVDRASMHHGVEARVPLLSKKLVEGAISIPTSAHLSDGERKSVLKRAIRGRVPDALLTNRKKGFGLPLEPSVGSLLRRWARDVKHSALARDGVIQPKLDPRISENLDQLWTLFVLDKWWRQWVNPT